MSLDELLAITPSPFISGLLWLILLVTVLYLARTPAHTAIGWFGRVVHNAFRMAAGSISRAERGLSERNREVLLAHGREAKERFIEREFDRVNDTMRKDLAGYPTLHRSLSDSIKRIEEDHQAAVEVPPDPPGWVKAVQAVASIDSRSEYMVGNILSDIHKALIKAHKDAMTDYRAASKKRHELLRDMLPYWRRIQQTLGSVGKNVDSLLKRSKAIDRHMEEYEDIVKGTDRAVHMLSSSSLVNFFVSSVVLGVAIGGAAINFSLIARPMAEMVGGTNLMGGFRTADIAALVIIAVEISMGLFMMESMRITRLFPVIGALPDKIRVRMIWVTFAILFLLATVEAGLAYMREILMQDELATTALLRGGDAVVVANEFAWITTAAQMGMGFILPFALVFVAIPLETFVHSLRTVIGFASVGMLRAAALVLRLIGNVFRHGGTLTQHVYDLPIFVPLWIEARIGQRKKRRQSDDYSEVSV